MTDNSPQDDRKHRQRAGALTSSDNHSSAAPEPADVFRITYRLLEDLARVRLAHGNRIRQVLPLIPANVLPPRGIPSWEIFFKTAAEVLESEEQRVLKLAARLLSEHTVGAWLLSQKGIGPALAVSILGETWPIGVACRPATVAEVDAGIALAPLVPPLITEAKAILTSAKTRHDFSEPQAARLAELEAEIARLHALIPAGAGMEAPHGCLHGPTCRFRNVGKLWAYAGLDVRDGKAPRRQKGVRANWNGRLRTRCWLFSQSALRARGGGPWRDVYDRRKAYEWAKVGGDPRLAPPLPDEEAAADALNTAGTQTTSALGGAPMLVDAQGGNPPAGPRPIVAHSRALRYTMKCLLRDLWRVAHGLPALIESRA